MLGAPGLDPLQILLLGLVAFFAATLAAVTGFGGAAVLLPALVAIFGARDAVPILTVAQLIGNGSRVWFNRHDLVMPVVGWFALGAIPLALLGGVLLAQAPLPILTRLIGLFLILTGIWRHILSRPTVRPSTRSFAAIGALFSFLSALVGSTGPLMAPFFLAYGLVKSAYIGTEALATVVMHLTKLVAYSGTTVLTPSNALAGLALGPLMVAGSFAGKRMLDRVPGHIFIWLIEGVLVISGLLLLLGVCG